MRNKLLLLLLLITPAFAVPSREKAQGYCEQGGQTVVVNSSVTSTGKVMKSYPGCTVAVFDTGTTNLSTIYSDTSGSAKANPFTADATTGAWFFYANDGIYDVRTSGSGISPTFTRGGYQLFNSQFDGTSGATPYPVKSKLLDWVSVRDYGALCDGTTDDHVAVQAAITYIQSVGGGTVIFPVGTCSIGTVGIHILPNSATSSGVRLLGTGKYSTLLKYTGSGDAVAIGTQGSFVYRSSLEKIGITITTAGVNAIGANFYTCLHCEALEAGVFTAFDRTTSRQIGMKLGGGTQGVTFGGFFQWLNTEIRGGFYRGLLIDGELGWGYNADQFIGGTVSSQGGVISGTIGIWLHQGNENVIENLDVENFATGIRSDAYDNTFLGSRTEGNTLGVNLTVRSGDCCAVPTSTTGCETCRFFGGSHSDGITNSTSAQIFATLAGGTYESHLNGTAYLDTPLHIPDNNYIAWEGVCGGSTGIFWRDGGIDNLFSQFCQGGILRFAINGTDYLHIDSNESPTRGVEFTKGIYRNGAGFQHIDIPAASICTTGASAGAQCQWTITWNTPFADNNYTPVCTVGPQTSGVPSLYIATQTASAIVGYIVAQSAVAANGGIKCIAVHI